MTVMIKQENLEAELPSLGYVYEVHQLEVIELNIDLKSVHQKDRQKDQLPFQVYHPS